MCLTELLKIFNMEISREAKNEGRENFGEQGLVFCSSGHRFGGLLSSAGAGSQV
jgi:hypothetical protein